MTGGARAETSHWIFCSSWGNPALKDNLIALKTFLGCPLEGLSPRPDCFSPLFLFLITQSLFAVEQLALDPWFYLVEETHHVKAPEIFVTAQWMPSLSAAGPHSFQQKVISWGTFSRVEIGPIPKDNLTMVKSPM